MLLIKSNNSSRSSQSVITNLWTLYYPLHQRKNVPLKLYIERMGKRFAKSRKLCVTICQKGLCNHLQIQSASLQKISTYPLNNYTLDDCSTDALWLVAIAIFGCKVQSLTLDYLKGLLKHYVLLRPIIHSLALSIIRIEFFKNTFHNVQTSAWDVFR